jgi:hypothetical protein
MKANFNKAAFGIVANNEGISVLRVANLPVS